MIKKITFLSFLLVPLLCLAQWTQLGADVNGFPLDVFGDKVSMSGDGQVMASSSIYNADGGADAGHVRVFHYTGGNWVQLGNTISGNPGDFFGTDLALNFDGTIIVVGASMANSDTGLVRVFELISGVWTQIGSDISGSGPDEHCGRAVSISDDGSRVVVGYPKNFGGATTPGFVRVFENSGGSWVQLGSDMNGTESGGEYGSFVTMSGNGQNIAIAAILTDTVNGPDTGVIQVFNYSGGSWTQLGTDFLGTVVDGSFGQGLDLDMDGDILAIGTPEHSIAPYKGRVEIYQYSGGIWNQIGSTINGIVDGEFAGHSVSINSSGNIVALGAPYSDEVRVYQYSGSWLLVDVAISNTPGGYFGADVSISADGTRISSGAPWLNGFDGVLKAFENNTLSTVENNFEAGLSLYPNPANDIVNLQFGVNHDEVTLEIYDILGKRISQTNYSDVDEISIDISHLQYGIYLLKVQSGLVTTSVKMIKQN